MRDTDWATVGLGLVFLLIVCMTVCPRVVGCLVCFGVYASTVAGALHKERLVCSQDLCYFGMSF